jgi:hypothetical protein
LISNVKREDVKREGVKRKPLFTFHVFTFHFAFCILTFLLVGCSSNAIVTVKPIHSRDTLTINFTRACYQKDQSGQDKIVLESDPIDEPPTAGAGQPIKPVTAPPLWQVLEIELHWRTAAAGNSDSPVAENAVMHWYVYGKPDGTALLHYVGTGAVSVAPNSSGAKVEIHSAQLRRIEQHGNLRDPLVDFKITGKFNAVEDPVHLKEIEEDLGKAIRDAASK